MNKALFGLLLGGFLGIFDGLSALVSTPQVAPQIVGIVIGSTVKGLIAGVLIGFFARRVNSLALGILFGLTVGLLLAFAVVAMQPPGQKYYWAIMLPGGLLGVIVGYATQRHAERAGKAGAAALLALLALALPAAARAEGAAAVAGKAAFARLKSLAGEWKGSAGKPDGPPAAARYQVTAGGNAVVETLFPGTDHEMMSVYYLDQGQLVLTHYCVAGNQPHMRLDTAASTGDTLIFAFDGGTNLDPAKDMHIHSARIALRGDRVESEWYSQAGGKPGPTEKLYLSRP